ncbi:hypothetical protein EYB25_009602 [Talaromyces marneffei]|nr:hypothetical protein EYB25_009602 [Talaromyces marneffei]
MGRVCCGCGCNLPRSSFKENEYSKGRGSSRCIECAQRHHSYTVSVVESSSGRYNHSELSIFKNSDLNKPFAQGTFRWVAKGKYLSGPRKGQRCVAKWFKNGAVFSDDFFCLDIKAVDKALEIVDRFNQLHIINKVIKINMPAVWRFDDDCEEDWAGQMALCEPYIHNYQKWNSNNGWHDDSTEWGKVMQAISHFSYHTSSGYYVLCDLQGGIHQHEVILSDPVILSQNRRYGITDLGLEGMGTFFSKHTCNEFCRPNWTKPDDRFQLLHSVPGTTMMDLKW